MNAQTKRISEFAAGIRPTFARYDDRLHLVAAAISGTDVQSLSSPQEIESVADRAVRLADAVLSRLER